jgi:hypothetical protein
VIAKTPAARSCVLIRRSVVGKISRGEPGVARHPTIAQSRLISSNSISNTSVALRPIFGG